MNGTSSSRMFGNTVQQFVCEPLNLNLILNGRSNGPTLREVSVLSVCGGKNDEFTKTVLEWLCRAKVVSKIHLLLCGQSKCIDKQLCVQEETVPSGDASVGANHGSEQQQQTAQQPPQQPQQSPWRRTAGIAKVDSKRQTNLPSQVQWQVLRPQIMVVGLHHFSELWSAKNCSNELLFPKNDWGNKYETNHYYRGRRHFANDGEDDHCSSGGGGGGGGGRNSGSNSSSSGDESARRNSDSGNDSGCGESDNSIDNANGNNNESSENNSVDSNSDSDDERETSDDDERNLARRKRRAAPLLVVEKSWRPTLYRTDVYRRAMLVECLALVAQHRPKIAFFHSIVEPSKQSERRRKDHVAWSQLLEVLSAFGSECLYRIRPIGLEMRDDDQDSDDNNGEKDAFPPRNTWCNAVFLERVDNGFECISRLHHEFLHYNNSADDVAAIGGAMQWIFHDHEPPRSPSGIAALQHAVVEQFTLDCAQLFTTPIGTVKRRKQTRLQKRKSLTVPVPVDFPTAYAKALAYYSVAQVVAVLE